ncbi:aspartate/glutamate racemase family protein [Aquincola tertiaricarbonis]|uniref:Aspartate/glutamate racemase family protein n=1 Tax=Aquincola tertiaricarbonis TaxID=391953 RepID=A0ABY4S980_AQUTE|nr:aspartate/glutamate racemase family protein [Aquincola tertiaricarbonis]URI09024.1 aspartate/glutamate racemase family protein [Aquincola tertiaricarbonis]
MANAPFLGVLMLDTRFPRLPGDIGHPHTFGFPVRRQVVAGASAQRVVREQAQGLLQPFIDTALQLVDEGAAAISTSCGFLALHQPQLQAALPVPVWSSSLLKLAELPAGSAGVVTVDPLALTPAHLHAVGAPADVPVAGLLPGSRLQRCLIGDEPELDAANAEAEVVAAALRLLQLQGPLQHIVLECTNMPPYAAAVHAATGATVHDIATVLTERWSALFHSQAK